MIPAKNLSADAGMALVHVLHLSGIPYKNLMTARDAALAIIARDGAARSTRRRTLPLENENDLIIFAGQREVEAIAGLLNRTHIRSYMDRHWLAAIPPSGSVPLVLPVGDDEKLMERFERLERQLIAEQELSGHNEYAALFYKILRHAGIGHEAESVTEDAASLRFIAPTRDITRLTKILDAGHVEYVKSPASRHPATLRPQYELTIPFTRSLYDRLERLDHVGKSTHDSLQRDRMGMSGPEIAQIAAAFDRAKRTGHYSVPALSVS